MKEREKKSKPIKEEGEDSAQWSPKRITIAVLVVLFLITVGYLLIQVRASSVLGESTRNDGVTHPEISIPEQNDVEKILKEAEENISEIDVENIVNSQPQIQNAIEELQKLTQEPNVKDAVCSFVCSEN